MISVVVPLYNERGSVRELHERLVTVLTSLGKPFEIIFVDDGSTDGTFEVVKELSPVCGLRLARNEGQTAAFGSGIERAKGDVVVTMDGDLENRPEDIPKLLKKLEEECDVAAGWRQGRWAGQFFTRRIPSQAANWLISRATGIRLHDHGCSLRAYKKAVFKDVRFIGEMHRMLAAHVGSRGARIVEVPVGHDPRRHGVSKYGLSRTFRVLLDVVAFYFFKRYARRPMHFFGYIGFVSIFLGGLVFLWALWYRLALEVHFNRTPLPILVAIFVVIGFQFILMGLLAETVMRKNGSGDLDSYDVAETIER